MCLSRLCDVTTFVLSIHRQSSGGVKCEGLRVMDKSVFANMVMVADPKAYFKVLGKCMKG